MLRPSMITLCLVLLAGCGKTQTDPPKTTAAPPALTSGIDAANFDRTIRPQDDLYRAVNGTWLKNTTIPADKSNYGSFTKLGDDAETQLRAIIENLAAKAGKADGSVEQKVGDFYAAFMDEAAIEQLGLKPLAEERAKIAAVRDRKELPLLMAQLARSGVPVPLRATVHQNPKDSTQYAGDFVQSGLGLPDRDYYLLDDAKFKGLREKYLAHIEKILSLAEVADAAAQAKRILALETQLARLQWDKVDNRDPVKTYNKFEASKLSALTPAIAWPEFLKEVGYGALPEILVSQPSYVSGFGTLLNQVPLDTWKSYLQWQLLNARAGLLTKAFVDADFAFYGQTLNGIAENRPRWKRGVEEIEAGLGEAVGQIYVQRHFPAENKARMEQLVKNLIKAYDVAIGELAWMGEDTRKAAKAKLAKFSYKIGYPDKWRDYSKLKVIAGDAAGNQVRAASFEYDRNIAKLGQPIDRGEWGMTPQTVNAYYNPEMNEIVFPAAILQPPFFDAAADDAVNYGGIGAVIGHEISHGFDDQGSQYDGDGNLRSWWTADDRKNFETRTAALAAQYEAYEPVEGFHLNGKFTLGENIADLGGLTIAYAAYQLSLNGAPAPVIDELSGAQRFFMGWAQVWRRNYRQENLLNRIKTDPHSPSEFRCNGVVPNVPGYYEAFKVLPSDKLYVAPEKRIKIW